MSIKTYLEKHARRLDFHLYEHLFEEKGSTTVLSELLTYQNADGGFGNALEPDLRLPDSSALATTVAFQYLAQVDSSTNNEMIGKALNYLLKSYDATRVGWINIPSSTNKYPRAPWWNYENAKASTEWGNPSAEILGYIPKYTAVTNTILMQELYEHAVQRLHEIDKPEQHEIKCYIRLYENAEHQLQKLLYNPLAKHIRQMSATNPKDWQGYAPTPLTFVTSPSSPFADLFDESLLVKNAQFLQNQIVDNNHWEPTWEWNRFEDDWAKAKLEWSGKITVENLQTLRAFGLNI